jgi:uncharacterized protein YecE (DUF72 family)
MGENQTDFRIGTSGWTYDHWKGRFYPEALPRSKWFGYYTAQFSTVEINATFYRTFKDQTYLNWRERAPAGFKYVLKAPRTITHRKYLEDVATDIREFWRAASLLEDKLGLILLQLAPATPYDPDRLRAALAAFQEPARVAVEFRHPRWLTGEVAGMLRELGVAICAADSPRSQLAAGSRLTDWVTARVGYIRLHGRRRWYAYDYSLQELEEIASIARRMADSGAETIYVFFNNDYEGCAPRNALTLMKLLKSA